MVREEVVHIPMEYYSATEMNIILPFGATWMDLEILIASDISQTENDKYHICKMQTIGTNELIHKQETEPQI